MTGVRPARPTQPARSLAARLGVLPARVAALLDRRAVLVKRGYVCDYEAGERPLPAPDPVLRYGRPALLPLSTVACVSADRKVVALTYDDGPHPEFTPAVLDALAAHAMTATFFVMVAEAEAHPELVRRTLAEGHEVALHGIDHTRLSALPLRRSVALIREGRERLEQVAGRRMTLFRPTYGAQTIQQLIATRALGLDVVVWSAWASDWDGSPAEVIARRALAALHQGGFMLLHDASGDGYDARTAGSGELDRGAATKLILAGMQERGYTSQTVSQLLAQYPAVRTVWAERPTS